MIPEVFVDIWLNAWKCLMHPGQTLLWSQVTRWLYSKLCKHSRKGNVTQQLQSGLVSSRAFWIRMPGTVISTAVISVEPKTRFQDAVRFVRTAPACQD